MAESQRDIDRTTAELDGWLVWIEDGSPHGRLMYYIFAAAELMDRRDYV